MLSLPSRKFTLITKLSPPHIVTRLKENVEEGPRTLRKAFFASKPYFGEISEQGFRIRPTHDSRHTTPIIITAAIISNFAEQHINVSIEIANIGLAAYIILLIAVVYMGMIMLSATHDIRALLFTVVLALLVYIPMIISFNMQVRKTKRVLAEILDADYYI